MADSGGPVELFVDIEELGRLRKELQTLEAELGDLPAQDVGADSGAESAIQDAITVPVAPVISENR
jgi:hypothetical protein